MADHYYSQNPAARHDRQHIVEMIKGKSLKFITDAGVFSKKRIDFGSRLLIEQINFSSHAKLLDVGCGYGPIGLFAASFMPEGNITMIDINERAIALAIENAHLNQIENVCIFQSNLYEKLTNEKYTIIVTNPPIRAGKEVVHQIYEQALEHLLPGGELWVVIQKKQGAESTLHKLLQLFERVEVITQDKGYRIFRAMK